MFGPKSVALDNEHDPRRRSFTACLGRQGIQKRLEHHGPGPERDALECVAAVELVGRDHFHWVVHVQFTVRLKVRE